MLLTVDLLNFFMMGNVLGGITTAFCLMLYQRRTGLFTEPLSCSGNGVFVIGNSGNVEVHPMSDFDDESDENSEDETTEETNSTPHFTTESVRNVTHHTI